MHTFTVIRSLARPAHTEQTRVRDEVDLFCEPLTDAELAQYARRTSKRPALCLMAVIAAAIFAEPLIDAVETAIHWIAGVL